MLRGDPEVASHVRDRPEPSCIGTRHSPRRFLNSGCDGSSPRLSSHGVDPLVEVDPDHPGVLPDPGNERRASTQASKTSRKSDQLGIIRYSINVTRAISGIPSA